MRLLVPAILAAVAVVLAMALVADQRPGAAAGGEAVLWQQRMNGPSGADQLALRLEPDGSIVATLDTDYPATPRTGTFTAEERAERARLEAAAPAQDWSSEREGSEAWTQVTVPRPGGASVFSYASDAASAKPPASVAALADFYAAVWKRLMERSG